jgi:hypothetical protein
MSSRKKPNDPWWFSPSIFDVVAIDKVYQQSKLPPLLIQKVLHALAEARFPTRPRRAKKEWVESVYVDGTTFVLSCHIDQNEKKIVVKNIRPTKKLTRPKRHK